MRFLTGFLVLFVAQAQEWPAHRGAQRDGVYPGPIRIDWAARPPRQVWKINIGDGYSGVSIADGKVFTIEQRKKQEVAVAYSLETGKELWASGWPADFHSFLGGKGPRSTPTWDAGHVYVQGAEGELRCLDANSGKTIWRKNMVAENGGKQAAYGVAISPLLVRNLLVTNPGGKGGKSIAAFDKETGAKAWSVLDDGPAYTSPMLVTLAGTEQILAVTAKRVVGLEVKDGSLLWETPWSTSFDVSAAQPVLVSPDRFVISAGYGHGAALVEVKGGKASVVWENKLLKNKFNSSVYSNGFIYGLDENILSCIDAATGQRKWKGGRYGYGQVSLAQGQLIVTTESGEVALVRADPGQFQEVAKFQAIDGKTWNQPAIANGNLVVRNEKQMACFDLLQ